MKSMIVGMMSLILPLSGAAALIAAEKKVEGKKAAEPAKAKAQKATGDIGLLDTEKNYMIVVTKEGKLVTIDYNAKTKVTAMVPGPAKMADIGLGSAASVQYTEKGGKNYLVAVEYVEKKGGE